MRIWTILAIALMILLAGCSSPTGNAVREETIKIGYIGPLSGNTADIGESQRNALTLAVEKVNAAGGINGTNVEIIFEDTKHETREAYTAAKKLIELDNVAGIIGPTGSSPTMTIAPLVEQSKVPLISPIATSPIVRYAGDYVFRTMPSVDLQTKDLARFAKKNGYKSVGVLYINNAFGKGAANAFTSYFREMGGKVTVIETHDMLNTDFRTAITRLKDAEAEALFIGSYATEAGYIIKQAREMKYEGDIFGVETLGQKRMLTITGTSADGVVYAEPKKLTSKWFVKEYQERFGKEPLFGADTAYDGFMLIVEAIRKCGKDGEKVKDCIYQIGQGYEGISGNITFDSYGDVDKPFGLFRIENGTGGPLSE